MHIIFMIEPYGYILNMAKLKSVTVIHLKPKGYNVMSRAVIHRPEINSVDLAINIFQNFHIDLSIPVVYQLGL